MDRDIPIHAQADVSRLVVFDVEFADSLDVEFSDFVDEPACYRAIGRAWRVQFPVELALKRSLNGVFLALHFRENDAPFSPLPVIW